MMLKFAKICFPRYQDFSLPGIFAPRSESSQWEPSLPGTKVPGNFRSWERMFPGTFVPGIVSSFLTTVRDAGAAVKVNRKNIVK